MKSKTFDAKVYQNKNNKQITIVVPKKKSNFPNKFPPECKVKLEWQ